MMYLYHIVLLAFFNITSGSVIINFYDDGENTVSHSAASCNYQACDQLCRRLGFPGGACVGDKCQCDNFQPLHVKSQALGHLLNSWSKPTVEACDDATCDHQCKQYGYQGGICSGGECYCWKHKQSDVKGLISIAKIENNDETQNNVINKNELVGLPKGNGVSLCFDAICSLTCTHGGLCIGDYCLCY